MKWRQSFPSKFSLLCQPVVFSCGGMNRCEHSKNNSGECKTEIHRSKSKTAAPAGPRNGGNKVRKRVSQADLYADLAEIASSIRRIGSRGATPESILIDKHDCADRLIAIARQIGGAA